MQFFGIAELHFCFLQIVICIVKIGLNIIEHFTLRLDEDVQLLEKFIQLIYALF